MWLLLIGTVFMIASVIIGGVFNTALLLLIVYRTPKQKLVYSRVFLLYLTWLRGQASLGEVWLCWEEKNSSAMIRPHFLLRFALESQFYSGWVCALFIYVHSWLEMSPHLFGLGEKCVSKNFNILLGLFWTENTSKSYIRKCIIKILLAWNCLAAPVHFLNARPVRSVQKSDMWYNTCKVRISKSIYYKKLKYLPSPQYMSAYWPQITKSTTFFSCSIYLFV